MIEGWARGLTALGAAVGLASCAVGPDFSRPSAPENAGYAPRSLPQVTAAAPILDGGQQNFLSGAVVPFKWWTLFGSQGLDSLVDRALRASPTIEAAKAALAEAQENVYAQQGYFFPTIGAGYTFERQQLAGNQGGNSPGIQGNGSVISTYQNPAGPAPYNGPVTYNFHTAQVTVGFTPDVFGGNRRQVESLDAQAQMQRFELEAAYITLASNVVAAAIQEASVRQQIKDVDHIIEANEKTLDLLREQYRDGFAMGIDVATQEAALAQAKQLLPPLQKQLEQTRDLLRALVGNLPNQDVDPIFDIASLHLPQDLPLSLPSKIIEQRPDVRAAEEQLHSASAQVGVAVANELPQFSITGAAGGGASEFDQIFSTGGPFWNIIGSASQTLFDGGTLLHRKRAADQGLIQAAAQYRGTVISAYQNVADTLHALISDGDNISAAAASDRAAKAALDLTRQQADVGFTNYIALFNAEQTYQQAELILVQAQAARLGDTAALFQALGGGWWNRGELETTKVAANTPDERQ